MSSVKRVLFYYKELGIKYTLRFILSKYYTRKLKDYKKYIDLFKGKSGLEIGGPSIYFNEDNVLPLYPVLEGLDGVNFSTNTIWEGSLSEGQTFRYNNSQKSGQQYICDAVNLSIISSKKYDFVISCNNLEHIANPLRAINEWLQIIKTNGLVLLVLPNKQINFDHRRTVTSFEHLLNDYNTQVGEDDMTHIDEIMNAHDIFLDPLAGNLIAFRERALQNYENRALHHHVFDIPLLIQIYEFFNIKIISFESTFTDHYILGKKNFRLNEMHSKS